MFAWPSKDPDEVLDYQIDWATDRLDEGETITTTLWQVESGDVVIDSDEELDGVTTVWLSGGTVDTSSIVLNRITTSAGRIYDQSCRLRVRTK
jgi:hypothetical protein